MMVPGRAGYSVIGDESIEFVRTPQDYVERRRASYGDVFLGRVLNRPTVFLTSNKAVQDLLNGKLLVGTQCVAVWRLRCQETLLSTISSATSCGVFVVKRFLVLSCLPEHG